MTACTIGCGGKCCRDFTLPFAPDEIEAQAHVRGAGGPLRWGEENEAWLLSGCLVYLGERSSPPGSRIDGPEPPTHHYACRHLGRDGLCRVYEQRPPVCRDYPYGSRCRYAGCASHPPMLRSPRTRRAYLALERLGEWWKHHRINRAVRQAKARLAAIKKEASA